ncbi:MAG TPA: hypothetical protein ENI65_04305 [Gammaproteobacteria bacterium]|nr:hypothetical protein [Gammaproteobacteria bacterium]
MENQQKPVPGKYYVNLTGQLIKVRYLIYSHGEISLILLEYQDGHQISVDCQEWNWLDLKHYTDWFLDNRKSADSGLEV